jgi:hypothetical protein
MNDWTTFVGVIETLEWGSADYMVLRLPVAAEAALAGAERHGG